MYHAELKGKLPPSATRLEDVLTSNVFSFLKYADRRTYLQPFLNLVGIDVSENELNRVEFCFWPCYDDGTEPDVVILTKDYYLLVEAKYHSDVAKEDGNPAGQVVRECGAGCMEAKNLSKSFRLLLLTDDAVFPYGLLSSIPATQRDSVTWANWQSIAALLLAKIEKSDPPADFLFAKDLYRLLDEKHLRGFTSFERLASPQPKSPKGAVFFAAETATFRGAFLGFETALSVCHRVRASPGPIFHCENVQEARLVRGREI